MKEGDTADCFYINFSGRLNVIKYNQYTLLLNPEEYLNVLIDLDSKYEMECLKMTIRSNKDIFNITKNDIKCLKILLMTCKFRKMIKESSINMKNIIDLLQEYNIDIERFKVKKVEKEKSALKALSERILQFYISYNEAKNYEFLEIEEKKMLTIHEENILFEITNGMLFGDIAIDNKTFQRSATIKAQIDSYLGKIKYEIYRDFILSEKQKIIAKEMSFLNDNFFFKYIKPYIFRKRVFYDFVKLDYPKGKVITNDKEITQYLYFIKEGEIELKIDISLLDLNHLIFNLISETKCIPEEENYDIPDLESKDYEMIKKKTFKIYIFGSKEIIGADCYLFNIPCFYKAIVHSEKAKVFRIDTKKITSTLNEEQESKTFFEEYTKNKFVIVLKRLIEIRDTYLKFLLNNTDVEMKKKPKKIKTVNMKKMNENSLPSIYTTTHIEPQYYKKIVSPDFHKKKTEIKIDTSKTMLKFSSFSPLPQRMEIKHKKNLTFGNSNIPRISNNLDNTNLNLPVKPIHEVKNVKKLNKSVLDINFFNHITEVDKVKNTKTSQYAEVYDQEILQTLPKISIVNFLETDMPSTNSRNKHNSTKTFQSADGRLNPNDLKKSIILIKHNNEIIKGYKDILKSMQSKHKGSMGNIKKLSFYQNIINK